MAPEHTSTDARRERTFPVSVDGRHYELRAVYVLPDWTLIDLVSHSLGNVTKTQHDADIQRLREAAQAMGKTLYQQHTAARTASRAPRDDAA